ncbi:GTP cyclohydrolase FolE2 [Thiomicrorhabdus arctica]|uniref:GTP cyclohydrolase FolE2 n=1 Tax=Thiomicrorhabdus arctica TaxID=131540 RepID=UPI00036585F9|nr:GTP cyclohydrolase FolE2 [Thiomicrorhabdus arctica]
MTKHMPDIACQPHQAPQGKLNWVGMSGIELPILVQQGLEPRNSVRLSSKAQAYVSLDDPMSKGIHMSRLYLILDQMGTQENLTPNRVKIILEKFIESHHDLSNQAFVEFKFDYYERRQSLKSDNSGWKHYPTTIRGEIRQGKFECEVSIEIPYSSTCPCSAALSRQLIQEAFTKQFNAQANKGLDYQAVVDWLGTPEGINATPHSQRSYAQVKVKVIESDKLEISTLINQLEDAVQTPVQAVVKREDEQEFARLNASNLMFCEDASRRIQNKLNALPEYSDYWVRVNHLESLHPHDAVAIVTKGIENGYIDEPNLMDPM